MKNQLALLFVALSLVPAFAKPEAFEIGPQDTAQLPGGKEADGIIGDFVLRNDSISGNHCVLDCNREGEWSITDLNSGNGVVLNGTLVKQAALRQGDTIELGELKMRFLLRA